jgi:hypothetical protein
MEHSDEPRARSPEPLFPSDYDVSHCFKRPGTPSPRERRVASHWEPRKRDWIPAYQSQHHGHRRRRCLILCFDGTGDAFDDDNSNVVQLVSVLKKNNDHEVGSFP